MSGEDKPFPRVAGLTTNFGGAVEFSDIPVAGCSLGRLTPEAIAAIRGVLDRHERLHAEMQARQAERATPKPEEAAP